MKTYVGPKKVCFLGTWTMTDLKYKTGFLTLHYLLPAPTTHIFLHGNSAWNALP